MRTILLLLTPVCIDALCTFPKRCCYVICADNEQDIACVNGHRVHCLQMATLLELSETLNSQGYKFNDHFNISNRDQLSVQFVDINIMQNAYFVQYSFLSSLRLFYCGIRRMESNVFDGLSNLRTLHIVGLNLAEFDMAVLVDVPHLRQLTITDSRTAIARMESIHNSNGRLLLEDLEEMDLSGNGISFIQQGLFDQAPNLKVLSLADNELEYLPTRAFAGSTALVDIDLTGNRLKSLQSDTFANVQPFATIRLRKNSLLCQTEALEAIMCAIQKPRHVYIDWNLTEFSMSASIQRLADACEVHQQHLKQLAEAMIIMRSGPSQSGAMSLHVSTTVIQTLFYTLLSAAFAFANSVSS